MAKSHNLYKIGDVARVLGLHPNTIRNWEKTGKITPKVRFNGTGTRYYDPAQIDAMAKQTDTGRYLTIEELEEVLGVNLTNCGWALSEPRYDRYELEAKKADIVEYLTSS